MFLVPQCTQQQTWSYLNCAVLPCATLDKMQVVLKSDQLKLSIAATRSRQVQTASLESKDATLEQYRQQMEGLRAEAAQAPSAQGIVGSDEAIG